MHSYFQALLSCSGKLDQLKFLGYLSCIKKGKKKLSSKKKKKKNLFELFLPPIKQVLNRTSEANPGNPHHTYLQSQLQQIHIFPDKVQRIHAASAIRDI